ncbi:hypothetical protein V499_09073 [Pseudogymnoascus sp. VKM F-103]|nr:hypothetical protein V499_09073 [Pseudogymnoascus sp. VKM F-103]
MIDHIVDLDIGIQPCQSRYGKGWILKPTSEAPKNLRTTAARLVGLSTEGLVTTLQLHSTEGEVNLICDILGGPGPVADVANPLLIGQATTTSPYPRRRSGTTSQPQTSAMDQQGPKRAVRQN